MTKHLFLFATLALAGAMPGQQSAEPKPAPAKAPFVFDAGVTELRVLIERCGAYLQRNILVDDLELTLGGRRPKAPPGAAAGAGPDAGPSGPVVELQLPIVTDRDGCEEVLASLLWTRGLALVPLDEPRGLWEVLAMQGARGRDVPLRAVQRTPEQVLARPSLRLFVTVVCTLEHVNATIATNALRPFFASAGGPPGIATLTLGNVGTAASIVLNGPQDMVASALLVLRAADVPQPPDARPELDARISGLARQNEQLQQRIAALEEAAKARR
jgi:hypothetical protein